MRKFFVTSMILLCSVFVFTNFGHAQSRLTQEEIDTEILRIADSYEVGESLNSTDQDFIKQYADLPSNPKLRGYSEKNVNGGNSNAYITASLIGKIYSNIGIINNNFGGTLTTNVSKGTPDVIKTKIRHVAFGAIGSGGTIVGKVQDKTLTATCKEKKSCKITDKYPYVASVAYANTYAEAEITYNGGNKIGIE